jgi:hypothetical protein
VKNDPDDVLPAATFTYYDAFRILMYGPRSKSDQVKLRRIRTYLRESAKLYRELAVLAPAIVAGWQ